MRYVFSALLILVAAMPVLAQAPVEDVRQREDALQRGQRKAGAAYRELQQAEYEAKRAEQDYARAEANYKAAQKRADELKRQADAAKKNLGTAQAKEAGARKSYDAAVDAVDRSSPRPSPNSK